MTTLQAIANGYVIDGHYVRDFETAVTAFAEAVGKDLAYRPFEAPAYSVEQCIYTYRVPTKADPES